MAYFGEQRRDDADHRCAIEAKRSDAYVELTSLLSALSKNNRFHDYLRTPKLQRALNHWTGKSRIPIEGRRFLNEDPEISYVFQQFTRLDMLSKTADVSFPLKHMLTREDPLLIASSGKEDGTPTPAVPAAPSAKQSALNKAWCNKKRQEWKDGSSKVAKRFATNAELESWLNERCHFANEKAEQRKNQKVQQLKNQPKLKQQQQGDTNKSATEVTALPEVRQSTAEEQTTGKCNFAVEAPRRSWKEQLMMSFLQVVVLAVILQLMKWSRAGPFAHLSSGIETIGQQGAQGVALGSQGTSTPQMEGSDSDIFLDIIDNEL